MDKIEYMRTADGDEVAMKIGSVCVLGPMMNDDDDLLHVMFGKREDGQYRAQVDRKNETGIEHLLGWHGAIEGTDTEKTWRIH